MSGSTQPVTQSWRAAEPRYPPHAMSYPVQIARPHAVRGAFATVLVFLGVVIHTFICWKQNASLCRSSRNLQNGRVYGAKR
ncbi:hypothetical protein llap_20974 [Limosa lapponica baueri]|uniref:Uncharacterized protein n=1 Tax=Limosa lapponica baueri TaxID=1758121 RepID=A0A2I0T4K2_LIMLA|nr:hypothetical protein llap_20974 [Limosa lapponica baueri]